MPIDIRTEAARYYDLNPTVFDDIPFYRDRISSRDASVLELGCGTGRVLIPLIQDCSFIHGVDVSESMVAICRNKLTQASISAANACVQVGDITNLNLDKTFDLITAPFRVFQNLETDADTDGFFQTVQKHLSPGGRCVLNVFKPNLDPATLRKEWVNQEEYESWEIVMGNERITCHGKNSRMDPDKMILYPEQIYRKYRDNYLVEEVILKIVMRAYYADEFVHLITRHGFKIFHRWGGYGGESYGEGPELVVEFGQSS